MTNNLSWPERHAFAEAALCATASAFNGIVCPVWLDDLNFWYERRDASGE